MGKEVEGRGIRGGVNKEADLHPETGLFGYSGTATRYLLRERDLEREVEVRLRGTLAPARRASESPIAIACFRLVTFLPDPPLLKVPRFRSRITFATFFWAALPYLAMGCSLFECWLSSPA